jgi:WD40 repeat protein
VTTLSNELDFLHHNICFTCRWRFAPAQSSSRLASNPLVRRLFRPSRRPPAHVLPSNRDDSGSETPTVTSRPTSVSVISVDEVPPRPHTLSTSITSGPTDHHVLLPSNPSVADTPVASGETIGMISSEVETDENEHSDIVSYNPQVERQLDLDIAHTFRYNTLVLCATFSPDGKYLAVGLESGKSRIYDVKTCSQIWLVSPYHQLSRH